MKTCLSNALSENVPTVDGLTRLNSSDIRNISGMGSGDGGGDGVAIVSWCYWGFDVP